LIRGAELNQDLAGQGRRGFQLIPEPSADGAVGDGGVMQHHKRRHNAAQAVNVEIAGTSDALIRRRSNDRRSRKGTHLYPLYSFIRSNPAAGLRE
jgi:hypothetical protein